MARLDGSYGGVREGTRDTTNPPGGGGEGVWAEPLRLVDYVHFHLRLGDLATVQLESRCVEYVRQPGYSRFRHWLPGLPDLEVEKRVWVPLHLPAAVFALSLRNQGQSPLRLQVCAEVRSSLGLGWPRRDRARERHRYDAELQAVVAADEAHPDWLALWGADRPAAGLLLGAFRPGLLSAPLPPPPAAAGPPGGRTSALQVDLSIAPGAEERLSLVVCGGARGRDEAELAYRSALAGLEDLFHERLEHYRRVALEGTVLASPDPALDQAFLWAKASLEDFKHFDPVLGLGFFAGFPAYNFYFASDALRLLHGAIQVGDWADTREALRMMVRFQAHEVGPDTLPGEIWHEMPTTGERIAPNFCTLDLPPLVESFYRWSGDRPFLEEIYPHVRAAVEWGYLKDSDGDGLLENGPEGEMADSAFEGANVEGSHVGPNLAWCRALRTGARLAAIVGDAASAQRWRATEGPLARRLDGLYWSEARRAFDETLRPDGVLDSTGRGPAVTEAATVDEGKARLGLARLEEEERALTDRLAFARRREAEEEAGVWRGCLSYYLVERGERACLLLKGHHLEAGLRALVEMARLPFQVATPGQFPEVIDVAEPHRLAVRGCDHQAWSGPCGVLQPVVEGLFGVEPDAPRHAVTLVPHLPEDWPSMELRDLRVGEHRLDIACRREDEAVECQVRNEGRAALRARVGLPVPWAVELLALEAGGRALAPEDLVPCGQAGHLFASFEVGAGSQSSLRLSWRPAPLRLEAPLLLERACPGDTVRLEVRLANQGPRPVTGRLRLTWPDGLPTPPAHPLRLEPDQEVAAVFELALPLSPRLGYHTLTLSLEDAGPLVAVRRLYLPVFPALEARLDGREVSRLGRPYCLRVSVTNLTSGPRRARIELRPPAGLAATQAEAELSLGAGEGGVAEMTLLPRAAGRWLVPVHLTADGHREELVHEVEVLSPERALVVYSGFLGPPINGDEAIRLASMPANYAVRRPHVLSQWLARADLLLTSDQHDAVFRPEQAEEMVHYVARGGRLFLFCYWSSAWGRGFHDTLGTVAGTSLATILPLQMQRGIASGRRVKLAGDGRALLGHLPWDTCPPFDYNLAGARAGAQVWARSEEGHPLLAVGRRGRGWVAALAVDCFGYGNSGTFQAWPGTTRLIRGVVDALLARTAEPAHWGEGGF